MQLSSATGPSPRPWARGGPRRPGQALTHRGREAAERVVLPAEHHGACWELLSAAARDVLACRQGEPLGGHRGDCVGQRDRSLVHLQERDPELRGGHSAAAEVRKSRWTSFSSLLYLGPTHCRSGCYLLPQAPESPLGTQEGLSSSITHPPCGPREGPSLLWASMYQPVHQG